ncbi:myb/SANT-like DNA-binding domain-containing protein 4 [Prorops nasuta]|uniref:myb/SANT-like DNA-binding domain-containing protein 4 n=1 Tax=Prorops nasuta TaxID=863751 RepID=UPI0034CD3445
MSEHKKKRQSFTYEEKMKLIEIIKEFASIIENKKTDTVASAEKNKTWEEISSRFNAIYGEKISIETLKQFWHNIKSQTRKYYANLKLEQRKTGGGRNYVKPNTIYESAYEIIQKSIDGFYNRHDSDQSISSMTICTDSVLNSQENENEDPDDPVFDFLIKENHIDKWNKWDPSKLQQPVSEPLKVIKNGPLKARFSATHPYKNVESMQHTLLKCKIDLAEIMKKQLHEKHDLEMELLKKQCTKESVAINLLNSKLNIALKERNNNKNSEYTLEYSI